MNTQTSAHKKKTTSKIKTQPIQHKNANHEKPSKPVVLPEEKVLDRIPTMDPTKVLSWIEKTSITIDNCRGGHDLKTNYHLNRLVTRYNALKARALILNIWNDKFEKVIRITPAISAVK